MAYILLEHIKLHIDTNTLKNLSWYCIISAACDSKSNIFYTNYLKFHNTTPMTKLVRTSKEITVFWAPEAGLGVWVLLFTGVLFPLLLAGTVPFLNPLFSIIDV